MGQLLAGAFMPHPPLIIPEVGAGHCARVADTMAAMRHLSARLVALNPDSVVITSPHGACGGPAIARAALMSGTMADFGAPASTLTFTLNNDLSEAIYNRVKGAAAGINMARADGQDLDSGAFVPLYYLYEAGFRGKIAHITPGLIDLPQAAALGRAIADAIKDYDAKAVFIGSGDLSHYLKDAPPYGLRPEGAIFDAKVVEALKENDMDKLLKLDRRLTERAGECGLRSLVCLMAAVGDFKSEFYSYEDSFGVGYAVAGWLEKTKIPVEVRLARWTIEQKLTGGALKAPAWADSLTDRAGAFVSLHKNGRLRGCIGTFLPQYPTLKEEIINNAIAAAFADPRFLPLTREEAAGLDISVDILSPPEQVCALSDLDARKYGVIVTNGRRQGLLLPDLDGVDTVDEQLSIARQKAGILPGEQIKVFRFTVNRRHV